jgi:hypothetical protein
MKERFTFTFDFTDSDGVTDTKTAIFESESIKVDDLLDWLPDALLAIGYPVAAQQLSEALKK